MKHLLVLCSLFFAGAVSATAATFTYTGPDTTTGNTWSNTADWTFGGTSTLGYPDSTSDTATINSVAANQTIIYDSSVSGAGINGSASFGQLSSLSLNEATAGVTNELDVQANLIIATALTLGSTAGTVLLYDDAQSSTFTGQNLSLADTAGITLNAGGTLEIHADLTSVTSTGNFIAVGTGTNGLLISGGSLVLEQASKNASSGSNATYITQTGTSQTQGNLTMTSGTLTLGAPILNPSPGTGSFAPTTDNRLEAATINITGGTINEVAGGGGSLYATGATTTINNVTYAAGVLPLTLNTSAATNTLNSNVVLGAFGIRPSNSGAHSYLINESNTATAGNIGAITIFSVAAGSANTTTMQLGANLKTTSGNVQVQMGFGSPVNNGFIKLDTNGFILDLNNGGIYNPGNSTTGTLETSYNLTSSSGLGTIIAQGFNFTTAAGGDAVGNYGVNVSNVILQATVAGDANNLGYNTTNITAGNQGIINANSTFYYAPTSGTATGTLTSNRAIGGVHVGVNGAATSTLQLISAITAGGNVQVDGTSMLDLKGNALALTNAANLSGAGSVVSTVAGGAITFGTGGLQPNPTVGSITPVNLTLGSGLTTTLSGTGTSLFNINSGTSNDTVTLAAGSSLIYAGTLSLDFTGGYMPAAGTSTYDLVLTGGTGSGNFSNITSNLTGDTYSFNSTTGILTVTAVPEPQTWALLLAGFGFALVWHRRFRRA
jgi:hypothetical protein